MPEGKSIKCVCCGKSLYPGNKVWRVLRVSAGREDIHSPCCSKECANIIRNEDNDALRKAQQKLKSHPPEMLAVESYLRLQGQTKKGGGGGSSQTPQKKTRAEAKIIEDPRNAITVIVGTYAVIGNPVGGWAAEVSISGEVSTMRGHEMGTTVNRLGLIALAEAVEALPDEKSDVILMSDLDYILDSIADGRVLSWASRGWRIGSGKPAAHSDLWEKILPALQRHSFHCVYANEKEFPVGNERAFRGVKAAARKEAEKEEEPRGGNAT